MMKIVQWTKGEVKLNKEAQSVQLENQNTYLEKRNKARLRREKKTTMSKN
jgi:hypothetical protein